MSNRYWLRIAALGGCLIAWSLADSANAQSVGNSPSSNANAEETLATPEQHTQPAAPPFLESIYSDINRLAEAVEAIRTQGDDPNKDAREQSDLAAQWEMANWAKWMFIATAIQALLAVLALFAIWRTLHWTKNAVKEAGNATKAAQDAVAQARKANEISAKASKASIEAVRESIAVTDRAWITVKAELIDSLSFDANDHIKTTINIVVENIGKSPAIQVQIVCGIHCGVIAADTDAKKLISMGNEFTMDSLNYGNVLFPEQKMQDENVLISMRAEEFREEIREITDPTNTTVAESIQLGETTFTHQWPNILVGVLYALPGDKRPRCTTMLYEIRHKNPDHHGFTGSENEVIAISDLVLKENAFVSGRIT